MRERISYYLSNMVTAQIGSDGRYGDLKQVISIVITDYDFTPETERYHPVFQMLEKDEHFPFNELMEIHVLNLARLPKDAEGKLADWLKFLKAETREEFKMLAERNPVINEAYCKLQVTSDDDEKRMIYEDRLKAQRDEYSRIEGALREGRQEGRREGQLVSRHHSNCGYSRFSLIRASAVVKRRLILLALPCCASHSMPPFLPASALSPVSAPKAHGC
jgi:predicted transposase/invertase (TIGR01784 family)